jgi:uncharacterized membrane protein YgaE (UPF0421/DUF939 family)
VAYLVRIGIGRGFRSYELAALGVVAALMVTFCLSGAPVGLAATLIVFALILARCSYGRAASMPMPLLGKIPAINWPSRE